jgi:hypothetical protein
MKKLRILITPIITLMLVLILGVTTFSWYTGIDSANLDVNNIQGNETIVNVSSALEGENADLIKVGDIYEYSSTNAMYKVRDSGEINGYAGQTGRLRDSLEDKAYIIFFGVSVYSNKKAQEWSKLDYGYIESCDITLASGEVEHHEPEEGHMGLDEFRVIFLEKTNYAKKYYYFREVNEMSVANKDEESNRINFFIGLKFHDGSNNVFPFSARKYMGSKFELNIKFDSTENNSFMQLRVLHPDQGQKVLADDETYTYKNQNCTYYDYIKQEGSNGDFMKQYTFATSDGQPFDLHEGDIINPYNKLTRTTYHVFDNWTDVTDTDGDANGDTFTMPKAENGKSLNDFVFYVKIYTNKISCYVQYPFDTYYYKGGNNGWKNAKMTEVNKDTSTKFYNYYSDEDNTVASQTRVEKNETMYQHAKDLYDTAFSYDKNGDNSAIPSTVLGQAKKGYFNGTTYANADTWSSWGNNYTQLSNDGGAREVFKDVTDYQMYYIDVVSDNVFEFLVFDTSDHYYKNSFNTDASNYKAGNGRWRIYLLVNQDTSKGLEIEGNNGTSSFRNGRDYKYRSVVIYEKIGDYDLAEDSFYIRGSFNNWEALDAYKFTYVPETITERGFTDPAHYEVKVSLDAKRKYIDSNGKEREANHEFKIANATFGVSWALDGFVSQDRIIPTDLAELGLNNATNPLSDYFEPQDENSQMSNIVLKRSGTYTFRLYYYLTTNSEGLPVTTAFIYVTGYEELI